MSVWHIIEGTDDSVIVCCGISPIAKIRRNREGRFDLNMPGSPKGEFSSARKAMEKICENTSEAIMEQLDVVETRLRNPITKEQMREQRDKPRAPVTPANAVEGPGTYDRDFVNVSNKCPRCEKGVLARRLNKATNAYFWGCSHFPSCTFTRGDTNVREKTHDGGEDDDERGYGETH